MNTSLHAPAMLLALTAFAGPTSGQDDGQAEKPVNTLPPATYMPVTSPHDFATIRDKDVANKSQVTQRQENLLNDRYELSDNPSEAMMSGGRKAVQHGVRVKLPAGATWQQLSEVSADRIREQNLFPSGFRPLPHAKHRTGGMVFPKIQIDAIQKAEHRDLSRFDMDFDLPHHLTPEFPPPLFLTSRPDLGDVSNGELLTIKNYYRLLEGKVTPVQMEGMRLLLTPFPQQQFNQTDDRKVAEPFRSGRDDGSDAEYVGFPADA